MDGDARAIEWHPGFHATELFFLVLNVLDASFTLVYVRSGVAIEANPLLAAAIGMGPMCFMAVKLALAMSALTVLHSLRRLPPARAAMVAGTAAYAAVVAWHVVHIPLGLPMLALAR